MPPDHDVDDDPDLTGFLEQCHALMVRFPSLWIEEGETPTPAAAAVTCLILRLSR